MGYAIYGLKNEASVLLGDQQPQPPMRRVAQQAHPLYLTGFYLEGGGSAGLQRLLASLLS